jgi:hypothetical protein
MGVSQLLFIRYKPHLGVIADSYSNPRLTSGINLAHFKPNNLTIIFPNAQDLT